MNLLHDSLLASIPSASAQRGIDLPSRIAHVRIKSTEVEFFILAADVIKNGDVHDVELTVWGRIIGHGGSVSHLRLSELSALNAAHAQIHRDEAFVPVTVGTLMAEVRL